METRGYTRLLLISSVALICLTISTVTISQAEEWVRTFGGPDNESAYGFQKTDDGGYIIAGYRGTGSSQDIYLMKTDADGNKTWSKTFGGLERERSNCVRQTSDGGYIIVGNKGEPPRDVYLLKTDSYGDYVWSKTFGGDGDDRGSEIEETSDGGYIIIGSTSSFGSGETDAYLIKVDADGNLVWSKTFGGTFNDAGSSVRQTTDGGYVLAGVLGDDTDSDIFMIKTDSSGNPIWSKTFGEESLSENGGSLAMTSDGGFAITGSRNQEGDYFPILIRTDASGNRLWTRTFRGLAGRAFSVKQTTDGGYILVGETSFLNSENINVQAFFLKTDQLGGLEWTHEYGGYGDCWDYLFEVEETDDGGFIAAGGTCTTAGGGDFLLIYYSYTPEEVTQASNPAVQLLLLGD